MGDITRNFHGGNAESAAANRSVEGAKAKSREKVRQAFILAGTEGLTSDEVQERLGGTHQGVSPRVTEMKADKVLVETDRKRKTRSGRWARVLVHVSFASDDEWKKSPLGQAATP